MFRLAIICSLLLVHALTIPARAMNPDPHHPSSDMEMSGPSTPEASGAQTAMMQGSPIELPDSRLGSGTAWQPDSTPMYGIMHESGKWGLMYHGVAHIAYDWQNGPRGDDELTSINWAMLMAQRELGERNQLRFSAMLSLEPLTVGGSGYPLLFQTGETWHGRPLKDHQHPHNFISELSAKYTRAITKDTAGFVYIAPVGEPALGPVAFLHRTQALDNPLAPIGHHWEDSTHIAFGVVTLGYQTQKWQLEASTFNGREPGENRYAIESPKFDSFSTRFSYNPSPDLSGQISYSFLKSPESLHPDVNLHRSTASVTYNKPLGGNKDFQTTLVWGRNNLQGRNLDSYLLDINLKHDGGWSPYARYEWTRKDAEELVLPATFPEEQAFRLQKLTLGVCRDILTKGEFQWGIGLQTNLNIVPSALKSVYGSNPTGWLLYVRVHPKRMSHGMAMNGMHDGQMDHH